MRSEDIELKFEGKVVGTARHLGDGRLYAMVGDERVIGLLNGESLAGYSVSITPKHSIRPGHNHRVMMLGDGLEPHCPICKLTHDFKVPRKLDSDA